MDKYLITHSLLSSWLYTLKENPFESSSEEKSPLDDFLRTLRREPSFTNEAMAKGIHFENLVTDICESQGDMADSMYIAATKVAQVVEGGSFQHTAIKELVINDVNIVLYGRLDVLKCGTIYDIKYSGSYDRGKFFDSTQHPTYFELIPEADKFEYLISNGNEVWTETYYREETKDIKPIISDFLDWLKVQGLWDTYIQYWVAK